MTDDALRDEPDDALRDEPDDADEGVAPARRSRLTYVLGALCAVALLVIAGTGGWLVRGGDDDPAPSASSVDVGFARDMSTHHKQAVAMAGYEYRNTTDVTLKLISYDILTAQQLELGRMQGWMDTWGVPVQYSGAQMRWMGHSYPQGTLMPGMATQAQLSKLYSSSGRTMDVLFLQLMIHHHQGGLPMAQYAQEHATQSVVRRTAAQMVYDQSAQIVDMEQELRRLGGQTLPPPTL